MWGERPGFAGFDVVVGERPVLTAGRFEYQTLEIGEARWAN
jgi:hypothetical protein